MACYVCPQVYLKFINREVHVPGKDLCDMSGAQGRTPDEFTGGQEMPPDPQQAVTSAACSAAQQLAQALARSGYDIRC
jgi:hypothetical protein